MCCDNRGLGYNHLKEDRRCKDCDAHIDNEGDALDMCAYSSTECETCGFAPCDGSC